MSNFLYPKRIFLFRKYIHFSKKTKNFITDLVIHDILSHMYFERTNTEQGG